LQQKVRPFAINLGKIDASNTCAPCREKIEPLLFGGLSPPNKKVTSLRPRRLCGEISILSLKSSNFLKNIDAIGAKSYIIFLIFERRDFLWQ